MSKHTIFDIKVASTMLEHSFPCMLETKTGEALHRFCSRQFIDSQFVLASGLDHARHHFALAVAYLQQTDLMIKLLAAALGKFLPQFICPQEQRDVVRMFEIRLPNNPRAAVGAAAIVSRRKAVQAEHFHT